MDLLAAPAPALAAALQSATLPDTLHSTPWLGLDGPEEPSVAPPSGQPVAAGAPGRSNAALPTAARATLSPSVRAAVAGALPERLAALPDQLRAQAAAPLAQPSPPPAAAATAATPPAAPLDRGTPVALLRAADSDPAALGEDADSDGGEAPRMATGARADGEAAARSRALSPEPPPASRAPTGPTLADPAVPGGLRAPSAPIATTQLAADGRFTDGKVPQQAGVTLPQKIEVDIQDGEHALRVTLAQEADGLVVEVRSPREAVAQLRALEPEIDAALADSGYDLNSYDAQEHGDAQGPGPDAGAHSARATRTPAGSEAAVAPAQVPAVSPDGQGRLLSREA